MGAWDAGYGQMSGTHSGAYMLGQTTGWDFGTKAVDALKDVGTSIIRATTPQQVPRVQLPVPRPVVPQSRVPNWVLPVVGASAAAVAIWMLVK